MAFHPVTASGITSKAEGVAPNRWLLRANAQFRFLLWFACLSLREQHIYASREWCVGLTLVLRLLYRSVSCCFVKYSEVHHMHIYCAQCTFRFSLGVADRLLILLCALESTWTPSSKIKGMQIDFYA